MCWYALASGLVGLENIDIREPYVPPIEQSYCIRKVEETINEFNGLLKEKWSCFK